MVECESILTAQQLSEILVLIDTWWNVNTLALFQLVKWLCFNRYMVECELCFISIILATYRVLIDTWWNVNYDRLACRKEAFEF